MKDTLKVIAGVVLGAGSVIGAGTIDAQEVITVNDKGQELEKVPFVIEKEKTENVVEFSGTLEQVNRIISGYDKVISQLNEKIAIAQAEQAKYRAIKAKIEGELGKLPEREAKVEESVSVNVIPDIVDEVLETK